MPTNEDLRELSKQEDKLSEEALIELILLMRGVQTDLKRDLSDFYNKYGKDGVVTYNEFNKWISEKNHTRRQTKLIFAIFTIINGSKSPLKKRFQQMIDDVIEKESDVFDMKLDQVDSIRAYKWGADELSWKQRLDKNLNTLVGKVTVDVKQSVANRENITSVLEKVDKRFTSAEHTMKTLVMTETTATTSATRKSLFKKSGKKMYRYYTKADERTCETCGELHGKEFPVSALEVGVNAPSMHPRCRCHIEFVD